MKKDQIAIHLMQIAYRGGEGDYKKFHRLISQALHVGVSEKELLAFFAKKTTKDNNIKNDSLEDVALNLAFSCGNQQSDPDRGKKLENLIKQIKEKLRLENFLRVRRMLPAKIFISPSVSPVLSEGAEESKANS